MIPRLAELPTCKHEGVHQVWGDGLPSDEIDSGMIGVNRNIEGKTVRIMA